MKPEIKLDYSHINIESDKSWSDNIKHPGHYKAFPLEVKEMMELILNEIDSRNLDYSSYQLAWFKDEMKYRFRAGLKGGLDKAQEDIAKAMECMELRNGK